MSILAISGFRSNIQNFLTCVDSKKYLSLDVVETCFEQVTKNNKVRELHNHRIIPRLQNRVCTELTMPRSQISIITLIRFVYSAYAWKNGAAWNTEMSRGIFVAAKRISKNIGTIEPSKLISKRISSSNCHCIYHQLGSILHEASSDTIPVYRMISESVITYMKTNIEYLHPLVVSHLFHKLCEKKSVDFELVDKVLGHFLSDKHQYSGGALYKVVCRLLQFIPEEKKQSMMDRIPVVLEGLFSKGDPNDLFYCLKIIKLLNIEVSEELKDLARPTIYKYSFEHKSIWLCTEFVSNLYFIGLTDQTIIRMYLQSILKKKFKWPIQDFVPCVNFICEKKLMTASIFLRVKTYIFENIEKMELKEFFPIYHLALQLFDEKDKKALIDLARKHLAKYTFEEQVPFLSKYPECDCFPTPFYFDLIRNKGNEILPAHLELCLVRLSVDDYKRLLFGYTYQGLKLPKAFFTKMENHIVASPHIFTPLDVFNLIKAMRLENLTPEGLFGVVTQVFPPDLEIEVHESLMEIKEPFSLSLIRELLFFYSQTNRADLGHEIMLRLHHIPEGHKFYVEVTRVFGEVKVKTEGALARVPEF
ncbi:MAG: hypothetical protein MRY21_07350 [Simkaniaceae bacterium]|nr:hypothetical protein [Simkaniaceae bacterium]